ncbi:hypothetical protein PRJ39_15900 [Lysobacter enzymogenes]|uniref:XAC0095 family protein n=1 Tax=Lysobacter enzymogenes TaxID=69 RepID=UPI00374A34EE
MQNVPSLASSAGYLLPVDAHRSLIQVRDQLRLLAQLAEPKGEQAVDVIYLSAEALALCFDRLADDLDSVAQAVVPSESQCC